MDKITFRALRNERASVIISGLILVVVMTLLAGALFDLSLLGSRIFRDSESSVQALYCVEAGGARALAEIVTAPDDPLSWDGELQSLPTPAGDCEYVATYGNTANPKILIATGTLGSVSRTLKWTAMGSGYGIMHGGKFSTFQISGNPNMSGNCAALHTNGDLIISGNPTCSGNVTASGTYQVTGNPTIEGFGSGGLDQKEVPTINLASYITAAKESLPDNQVFQMMSDGQILDGNNVEIAVLADGEIYRGWEYKLGSDPRWIYGDNNEFNGTYYLEGSVVISGNPGSPSIPWNTTVLATGNIEISGTVKMESHMADALLVSGGDIKISGNPEHEYGGILAAHEQIDISGNPKLAGNMVIEDVADSSSDLVTETKISGSPEITYDCALDHGVSTGTLEWKWQECANTECTA